MYVFVCTYMSICTRAHACMYVYVYVCVCVCMCVCVYNRIRGVIRRQSPAEYIAM